mgnify:CR=1 FL=1
MEIARQEATVKMYTFRMNSEPENYAALTEEYKDAEEKLAKPKVTEDFIRFWLLRFRKLNMNQKDQRQALVDTFINSIYLYDDKVLITFNYKEGTQTIPFEKVEESKAKGNGSDFDCVTAPSSEKDLVNFKVYKVFFCFPAKRCWSGLFLNPTTAYAVPAS